MHELDYYVDYDLTCPYCKHSPLHSRDCTNFCQDGVFDEADDDPINFYPGECFTPCPECLGTGVERWCPNCGKNLSNINFPDNDDDY
jgi:hypothetical protein